MLLYDDAYATTPAPAGTQGCLVYVGGDTPHPWTDQDIANQHVRYLLPVWVRSNMAGTPQGDADLLIAWLKAHKAPAGISVVLDLEMQVNPGYVIEFGKTLHAAGFRVLVYGSKSTLFGNPVLDGYFVADYTGSPHVMTGTKITQFEDGPSYDLDDVASGVVLWDTSTPDPAVPVPGPPPVPSPTPLEVAVAQTCVFNTADKNQQVFYVDANGIMQHAYWQPAGAWTHETLSSGWQPGSDLVAAQSSGGVYQVWGVLADGSRAQIYWSGTAWVTQPL